MSQNAANYCFTRNLGLDRRPDHRIPAASTARPMDLTTNMDPGFRGKFDRLINGRNGGHSRNLCALTLLLLANLCFAMPEDRVQIMQLRAGSADLDQQTHRGIYLSNVQLDQGTTHIRAAQAITETNVKNQLVKAVIKGNGDTQAHYWTLPAADKPLMHAYADTIYYYPERHLIELIGNARVEQGDDSFSAPKIRYDTLHQHVVSNSDGRGRTTIIIHPGKKS